MPRDTLHTVDKVSAVINLLVALHFTKTPQYVHLSLWALAMALIPFFVFVYVCIVCFFI